MKLNPNEPIAPIYCSKITGDSSKCACFATHIVELGHKSGNENYPTTKKYRCDKHKSSSTAGKKVLSCTPVDQSEAVKSLSAYLSSLVGKVIKSSFHRMDKSLVVQYPKGNGAVMCLNPHTRKYKLVYFRQIIEQ